MSVTPVHATAATGAAKLTKTHNGEYTADSVAAHPELAGGLIKLKDGNYAPPIVAAADRAGGLEAALTTLKHGG